MKNLYEQFKLKEMNVTVSEHNDEQLDDCDMREIQMYFDKPLTHENDVDDFEGFMLNGMHRI